MLQDAIWADTARLESDEEYAETTVAFAGPTTLDAIFSVASSGRGGTFHLEADGVDLTGDGFSPIEVELQEGGN